MLEYYFKLVYVLFSYLFFIIVIKFNLRILGTEGVIKIKYAHIQGGAQES